MGTMADWLVVLCRPDAFSLTERTLSTCDHRPTRQILTSRETGLPYQEISATERSSHLLECPSLGGGGWFSELP